MNDIVLEPLPKQLSWLPTKQRHRLIFLPRDCGAKFVALENDTLKVPIWSYDPPGAYGFTVVEAKALSDGLAKLDRKRNLLGRWGVLALLVAITLIVVDSFFKSAVFGIAAAAIFVCLGIYVYSIKRLSKRVWRWRKTWSKKVWEEPFGM